SLGTDQSDNLLQAVGDAYKRALDEDSGIPLFGVFLGAIILALGAFVLWLEMIIRDAAIYICVFFLPLTFVAMVWPATGRWARRLVELLIAIILAKFVIVSILTLATAAIANAGVAEGDSNTFEQMLAGSALLVLAAWSPFALLRMIPAMEVAAANVASQRSTVSAAAGSAGIHSPGTYMRQAMDRRSRHSAYATSSESTYRSEQATQRASARGADESAASPSGAGPRPGWPSTMTGGTIEPRSVSSSPVSETDARPAASPDAPPPRGTEPPPRPQRTRPQESPPTSPTPTSTPQPPPTPPPPQRARPPEPPPERGRPRDRGDA
ncbi:MAG TPA: hypothetical protein VNK94_04340, partial [Gaiellaceae bacterium]|nr:hypothetical protein [Gaiellaceae bacterium]